MNVFQEKSSSMNSQKIIKKISKPEEQLQELLTCQICYTMAKNIMMCPHCSKIYCEACIKKSLIIKSECPHCRKNVKDHKSMANCERFVNQVKYIVEEVLKEKQKENFRCDEHDVPLNYYCIECQRSVCCQCKMFGSHKEHNLVQVEKKYQEKYQKLRSMLAQLKVAVKQKEEIIKKFESFLDQINLQYKQELNHISNLEKSFDDFYSKEWKNRKEEEKKGIEKLENQLQKLREIKRNLRSQFSGLKKEGKYKFSQTQKFQLQKSVEQINSEVQSVKQSFFDDRSCLSEFIPPYQYNVFKIENFSKRQTEPKCIVYSEQVEVEGCKWKLKVYPNGSDFVEGKYLSIYVMMLQNQNQQNKAGQKIQEERKSLPNLYEYSIEIESTSNKNSKSEQSNILSGSRKKEKQKKMMREYASTFQPGESWGYIKFIQLKELHAQGYLDEANHDCLTIQYGIRRPDYFNSYKSLLNSLQSSESEIQFLEPFSQPKKKQIPDQNDQNQSYHQPEFSPKNQESL